MRHASAVLALLCLLLAACEAEFKNESEQFEGVLTVSSTKLDDFITARVVPSEEPEKYFVYFGWPRIEDKKRIRIRTDKQLALVEPTQTSFSHKTDHDQTLTYFFEILDEASRVERTFSKFVTVPKDLVVREGSNSLSLDLKLRVQRAFFLGVPFITNGHEFELIADEIHSEDGRIETFEDGSKAKIDVDGRSGGKLSIKAKHATGTLTVVLRGQEGGDGSKGADWLERAGRGSPAGRGGEYRCLGGGPRRETDPSCECTEVGHPAGEGAAGAKGRRGNPARNGGSTGVLQFELADGREFSLRNLKFPGRPGVPGPGGDGQLGGLGGEGDEHRDPRDCRGLAGKEGTQGPSGDIGLPGQLGSEEQTCIYIASEARNECL